MRLLLSIVTLTLYTLTASAQDPAGIAGGGWRGEWTSDKNGHHGPMRAFVRPLSDGSYRVWFAGRFAAVIPFAYPARLTVTGASPEGVLLNGSQYLGPGLGDFRTTATANPTLLDARFFAKRDSGRFVLTRGR
jgi:hypothetical protein